MEMDMQQVRIYRNFIFILIILFFSCDKIEWTKDFKIVKHELDIKLQPSQATVIAKDKIYLSLGSKNTILNLLLAKQFTIDSIFYNSKSIPFKTSESFDLNAVRQPNVIPDDLIQQKLTNVKLVKFRLQSKWKETSIEIFYHGELETISKDSAQYIKEVKNRIAISLDKKEEILLSDNFWYPNQLSSFTQYQIAVLAPIEYEIIAAGNLIKRLEQSDDSRLTVYGFNSPLSDISLFAGPYQLTPFEYGKFTLFAYLYPKHRKYAAKLLDAATQYLDFYEQLLGKYYFEKFAIIDSPFPIRQAFPSFCLIDSSQIIQPHIQEFDLSPLVCQSWFGESVLRKPFTGDWSKGLTTYLANHLLQEQISPDKGIDIRYHFLRKYSLEIEPENEIPLSDCWNNTVKLHENLNTTKGMMLFHQLNRKISPDSFFQALKELYQEKQGQFIEWTDLQQHFESFSKTPLNQFFDQWLNQKESPQFAIKNGKVSLRRRRYHTSALITTQYNSKGQDSVKFSTQLPVQIVAKRKSYSDILHVDSNIVAYDSTFRYRPNSLKLDPDFHTFRRLYPEEIKPYIGEIIHGDKKLFVLPGKAKRAMRKAYQKQIRKFIRRGEKYRIKYDYKVTNNDLKRYTVILFGGIKENRVTSRIKKHLPAGIAMVHDCFIYNKVTYWKPSHALIASMKNPYNSKRSILIYWGLSETSILSSANEVDDLQDYGFIILRDGRKITWKQYQVTQSPSIHNFETKKKSKPRSRSRRSKRRR